MGDAYWDIDEAAYMFEYYAGWATKVMGSIPPVGPEAMSLVIKEPVGVAALITPWNYPILMASQKIAPALAAGCTTILKPAEQTPLTAIELARIIDEAGAPPGVFNLLTGFGPRRGRHWSPIPVSTRCPSLARSRWGRSSRGRRRTR